LTITVVLFLSKERRRGFPRLRCAYF